MRIRLLARHFHLPDRFLPDHRLVQANVVQHAAQRILGVRMRHRILNRFADGDAQAAGAMRVFGQQFAPELGLIAGTGMNRRAPGVHQQPAIRLLLVADLDHIDVALQSKQLAGQGERRSPLARARFRRQPLGAGGLVEVSLRHRSIGLVAARRTGPFILVVDVRRRFQRPLQPHRPQQRRRPPQRIDLAHRFRDFDPPVRAHFLPHQVLGENLRHHLQRHRLARARMQRRRKGFGKIGQQIVPLLGNVRLRQHESGGLAHKFMGLGLY